MKISKAIAEDRTLIVEQLVREALARFEEEMVLAHARRKNGLCYLTKTKTENHSEWE